MDLDRMRADRRSGRDVTRRSVALVAALGLMSACGAGADTARSEGGLRTVRMGLVGAAMQMTFAPYTSVPESQGYWAEEGLKLRVQNLPGSTEVLQAIATGRVDTGVFLSPPLYAAAAAGVDVQSFYNLITKNFAAPRVPVDSPIRTIADIAGKTVGVSSLGAGSVALIRAMVASVGGDPTSVRFVAVGAGADVAEVVKRGEIDVVGLWDSVFATLEGAGLRLRRISNEFWDSLGFQGVVVASRSALRNDPDLFTRIGRAIAKGTLFTATSPRATVKAHWSVFPSSRPVGVPDDKALKTALAALEARLGSSDPVGGRYGFAQSTQIEEFGRALHQGGGLTSLPSADSIYTDALIEEINDFDREPVVADAKSYGSQR